MTRKSSYQSKDSGIEIMPVAKPPHPRRTEHRRFMTQRDVDAIVAIIENWPALPLKWEEIRTAVGRRMFGHSPKPRKGDRPVWSRQAISTNERIKQAYEDRRKALLAADAHGRARRKRTVDPLDVQLGREADRLRARVAELEAKLAEYEDYFRRVGLNRFRGAQTEEKLLEPLPPKVERGQEEP